MPDPYEVDAEGNAVAEEEAPAGDPLRRQVEATLRFMRLSTIVGLVIIAILAVILSDIRGVLILVGLVYLFTSIGAYWYLRRTFMARLKQHARPGSDA